MSDRARAVCHGSLAAALAAVAICASVNVSFFVCNVIFCVANAGFWIWFGVRSVRGQR